MALAARKSTPADLLSVRAAYTLIRSHPRTPGRSAHLRGLCDARARPCESRSCAPGQQVAGDCERGLMRAVIHSAWMDRWVYLQQDIPSV